MSDRDETIPELDEALALADKENGRASNVVCFPSEHEVKRLAALSALAYARERKDAAKKLGVGVAVLDKIVQHERKCNYATDELPHWMVEPWSAAVDGAALLEDIKNVLEYYVVLPKGAAEAIALWVLHAWTFDAGDVSPFLVFISPTKRCGKTTALILVLYLTPRSELASNISPSAVFRYLEQTRPTLLIDEADSFMRENEEMRGILNSGHTKAAAYVIRNVEVNGEHRPRRFSTWGPKVIAAIRGLADTLEDRAIAIQFQRKPKTAKIARLRRRDSDEFATLRRRVARWAADNLDKLADPDPAIPEVLNDRAADNWRPLLAIADLAGGPWPQRARNAACILSGEERDTADNVRLLIDIYAAFENAEILRSVDLVAKLKADPESPWAEWGHGKGLSQKQLAGLLRPFEIISEKIELPGQPQARGYRRVRFTEAWKAYLPGQTLSRGEVDGSEVSKCPEANENGRISRISEVSENEFRTDRKLPTCSTATEVPDTWTLQSSETGAKKGLATGSAQPAPAPNTPAPSPTPNRCNLCGGLGTSTDPLSPYDWPGYLDGIHLHRRCEALWFDRETRREAAS